MSNFGNRTIIYTKIGCPHCIAAKKLLSEKNVPFEEIRIDGLKITKQTMNEDIGRDDLVTVPQIILEGKFIPGGNSGLRKYYGL